MERDTHPPASEKEDIERECPICKEAEDSAAFLQLPCNHSYHRQCMMQWALTSPTDTVTCPMCRQTVEASFICMPISFVGKLRLQLSFWCLPLACGIDAALGIFVFLALFRNLPLIYVPVLILLYTRVPLVRAMYTMKTTAPLAVVIAFACVRLLGWKTTASQLGLYLMDAYLGFALQLSLQLAFTLLASPDTELRLRTKTNLRLRHQLLFCCGFLLSLVTVLRSTERLSHCFVGQILERKEITCF